MTGPALGAGVFRPLIHHLPAGARSITLNNRVHVWFAPCGAAVIPYDTTLANTHHTPCPTCPTTHNWPTTPEK